VPSERRIPNKQHKHHHNKKDIASRGMDPTVHRIASGAVYNFEHFDKPNTAYDSNGSDPSAFTGAADDHL
jgi:hypothetical protein